MRQEKLKIKQEVVDITLPETIVEARALWGDVHFLALACAEFRRSLKYSRRPDHAVLRGRLANLTDDQLKTLLEQAKADQSRKGAG